MIHNRRIPWNSRSGLGSLCESVLVSQTPPSSQSTSSATSSAKSNPPKPTCTNTLGLVNTAPSVRTFIRRRACDWATNHSGARGGRWCITTLVRDGQNVGFGSLRNGNPSLLEILRLGDFREILRSPNHQLTRSPSLRRATITARGPLESTPLTGVFRDLTQAAIDGQLEPIVGRDLELDSILEIFSNCRNKNPVLIGERGAGKTAIVEGVAQRIADGAVPSFLADKRILAFEPELIAGWAKERHGFEELTKIVSARKDPSEVILFLDELDGMLVSTSKSGWPSGIFKHALLHEEIQCIATATPNGYREATQAIPWLEECFRTIHVRPLDEESTLSVLLARKHRLEKFHQVTYTDEALECAAHSFGRHLPGSPLPGKALELLDAAGSRVKLRQHSPQEVADCLKRVKTIGQRFEDAIVNHEFEKAKFYSEEERKEKENLRVLREKHHLDDSSSAVVGREDVEEMLSRWATYPFCP
jgi:ATP-dependent Clp protease ATP-binding subunit ClpA